MEMSLTGFFLDGEGYEFDGDELDRILFRW